MREALKSTILVLVRLLSVNTMFVGLMSLWIM
jgi:hypothetical protein